jgi:16S rRNA (uracil1498-N3)-methyltransferase
MRDALRLKKGDKVALFDEKGNEYGCVIKELAGAIILAIKSRHPPRSPGLQAKITIACAIPKKSKIDDIIDKLTQLGVDTIIPIETQRVIVRLDEGKRIGRHKRWERIILSACEQSQRNTAAVLEPVQDLKAVLSKSDAYDLKLISTLYGERRPLKEALAGHRPRNILVLVGPEGDFTPEEVREAKAVGFVPVSLGGLVLRVETAAVAIASVLNYLLK